jgi:hypothetical protein
MHHVLLTRPRVLLYTQVFRRQWSLPPIKKKKKKKTAAAATPLSILAMHLADREAHGTSMSTSGYSSRTEAAVILRPCHEILAHRPVDIYLVVCMCIYMAGYVSVLACMCIGMYVCI